MFEHYDDIIRRAALKRGVPYPVARFLIKKESDFNPNAVSGKGAQGLGQLMPTTAADLGVQNPFDPEENADASMRYFRQGYDTYGTWPQAAGYYHSGPGNMKVAGGDITKLGPQGREYAMTFNQFNGTPPAQIDVPQGVPPQIPLPPMPEMAPAPEEGTSPAVRGLFNPYIQLALGIMAGNTGRTKSEAFANAMGGGLAAINASQRSNAYEQQVKAQNQKLQMERDQYNLMRQRAYYMMSYAQNKLRDPSLPPEQRQMFELMAQGNIEPAMELYKATQTNQYRQDMLDLRERSDEARAENQRLKIEASQQSLQPVDTRENSLTKGYMKDNKGNIYTPQGTKVEGKQQEWANTMLDLPPDQHMNFKTYEDKNNPLKVVGPTNFQDWIDMYGNYLDKPTPVDELGTKGYRFVDKSQRDDYAGAKVQLNNIADQWENMFRKGGIAETIKGLSSDSNLKRGLAGLATNVASAGFGSDKTSIAIREWERFVDTVLPTYAREIGHTGVLTQQDIDSIRPSLGRLTTDIKKGKLLPDTIEEVQRGLLKLTRLYESKGIKNKRLEGYINEFNALTTKSGRKIVD